MLGEVVGGYEMRVHLERYHETGEMYEIEQITPYFHCPDVAVDVSEEFMERYEKVTHDFQILQNELMEMYYKVIHSRATSS